MTLDLVGTILPWIIVAIGCWIGLQLVRQNGRILLRLDALERRLIAVTASAPQPSAMAASNAAPAPSPPAGLAIGSPAPAFELPDLSGTTRSLTEWRGRRLLLIFFNPQCGFCVQMAPDLAALRLDGNSQPVPLIVST